MNSKKYWTVMAGLFSLLAIASQPSQAVLVSAFFVGGQDGVPQSGNDCAGYFGDTFDACQIFVDNEGQEIELSPVIAKLDIGNGNTWETNETVFPSVTGDEFKIYGPGGDTDPVDQTDASGSWVYTPGEGDPGVRYWAVKSSNEFTLIWDVDQAVLDDGDCANSDYVSNNKNNYTYSCLNAANVISASDWKTQGQGISHITFYDTEVAGGDGTTGEEEIPEPGVLALLGMGLLGMLLARRRYS